MGHWRLAKAHGRSSVAACCVLPCLLFIQPSKTTAVNPARLPPPCAHATATTGGKGGAKRVPASFLEVVDCLVDVLLRYTGPPADLAPGAWPCRPPGAPAPCRAWRVAAEPLLRLAGLPALRALEALPYHARSHVPAGKGGAGGGGAAGPTVVRPGEVHVVANPDGTIDLLPTAEAAKAAAERKAAEEADRGRPLSPAQKELAVQCFALKLLSGGFAVRVSRSMAARDGTAEGAGGAVLHAQAAIEWAACG